MTDLERIEKFKNEKIAINCETEEEAKCFIEWCYENGFKWGNSEPSETYFYCYEDETCYTFDFDDCEHLGYGSKYFNEENGYEVIKYKDFMGIKRMTNWEHFVSNGLFDEGNTLCYIAHVCKYGVECGVKKCSKCEFDNVDLCVKTLLEEHKEPIKLKQWEYDLLKANLKTNINPSFNWYADLHTMKGNGYFKGVYDTSMTLREILNNCEVVE